MKLLSQGERERESIAYFRCEMRTLDILITSYHNTVIFDKEFLPRYAKHASILLQQSPSTHCDLILRH
jgi:hypothetical protein